MTRNVYTCHENDSIFDITTKMKEHNISGLPVIDEEDKVIGSITTAHISNLLDK